MMRKIANDRGGAGRDRGLCAQQRLGEVAYRKVSSRGGKGTPHLPRFADLRASCCIEELGDEVPHDDAEGEDVDRGRSLGVLVGAVVSVEAVS
jgi:hypothetical protein